MLTEKVLNKFPTYSGLNIVIIGSPQPERDNILSDEKFWEQEVRLHYCTSPQNLTRLLNTEPVFELIVYDYSESFNQWEGYRKIIEKYTGVVLFIVSSKVPKALELQLYRDNVYCVPFGIKNVRHLNCTMRTVRNHILRNRKYLQSLFDKAFNEFLINLSIDNNRISFEKSVAQLLSGLGNLFDFEVVLALVKEGNHPIQLFKNNDQINFCSLLQSNHGVRKICEDFLEGCATYIISEFLYKDFLRVNATKEKAYLIAQCLKEGEFCGLCHLLGYQSLIFIPFQTANRKRWLLIFADRKAGKATAEICQYFDEKMPFVASMVSYLEQYWREKSLLNLHQISLKTGHIGVWEYEVDTKKIISSGLRALFPMHHVPDELTEWWQYIHPSDRLNFWHAVKPCLQGATNTFAVDCRLLLPGDKLVWVRTIGECVARQGKYAKKLVGVGMDITSFMESEEEAKAVKETLQVASEYGNIGLWSWDILKNEYTINHTSKEMFRLQRPGPYTLEDWLQCIIPQQRELVRKELGETLAKEDGILNVQYPIYYRGVYNRWIHTYGRVSARDGKGNPIRISGTHVDITEKKSLEKQLASEVITNALYASFARSLLKVQSEEEVTGNVCQMGVDVLNSAFCFAGYFDPEGEKFIFYGVDKTKKNRFNISFSEEELAQKEKFLYRYIKAGIPLFVNEFKSKEQYLFGSISMERLMYYPSFTPSHELVMVIAVNSPENYSPASWEMIEWMSSVYAQAIERIRLERKNLQKTKELEETVKQLQEALNTVKKLHGLLPICARCKKIRDDAGYWHEVEVYIQKHSEAEFSHGICPQCAKELYGDFMP